MKLNYLQQEYQNKYGTVKSSQCLIKHDIAMAYDGVQVQLVHILLVSVFI
jgi:hypothetical protein